MDERRSNPTAPSRRDVIAAGSAGLVATSAGCVRRARNVATRDPVGPLSVTITTAVADYDREGIQIARRLAENLELVGIDASLRTVSREELRRSVLVNHDFELYVGRQPEFSDPDFLYELLHSRFAQESGRQNPFGLTSGTVDELLSRQRRAGAEDRPDAVAELLSVVARECPFAPICVPDEHRLVRDDRFAGWDDASLGDRLGYLGLEPLGEGDLRGVILDTLPTKNLNPLSVEFRNRGIFVDLVYDSLGALDGGDVRPWLAEEWCWEDRTATVTLREGVEWHDGESLDAHDVAFSYRLVADTSLGTGSMPAPAPRYRGLASIVEELEVEDGRTLSITVGAEPEPGVRAFLVPVLPEHVWEDRTDDATLFGFRSTPGTTEAIVTDNVPPVGSGPFAFADRTERDWLALDRVDDHFSRTAEELPEATVERLRATVHPRSTSAIEAIEADDADVTVSTLEAHSIAEVTETDAVRLVTQPPRTYYYVGFNVRSAPFANPEFRTILARLLDKAWLVEEVFEGQASPIASPATEEWLPDSLVWEDGDPVAPFLGDDGEPNVSATRGAFERAGFSYDGEGRLLARG